MFKSLVKVAAVTIVRELTKGAVKRFQKPKHLRNSYYKGK